MSEETLQTQDNKEEVQDNSKLLQAWRTKSAQDLAQDIKTETKNKKVQLQIDTILSRVSETCEHIAGYIEDVPSGMKFHNDAIRDVFTLIADSVRKIPFEPSMSLRDACFAKADAHRIPDLYQAARDLGYEEGYRAALKAKGNLSLSNIDIDID